MRAAVLFLLVAVGSVLAQDGGADKALDESRPELHKIYVPYKKFEEVFGKREHVTVPYEEFLELWKLKYGPDPRTDKPAVPFAVESAAYEGRVKEGIASCDVVMEIEVFEETWQRIPLGFKDVAFEEVLVDGEPGVLVPAGTADRPPIPEETLNRLKSSLPPEAQKELEVRLHPPSPGTGEGYELLLRGKGRHRVEAKLVAGVAKGKEYATTAFGLPAVPLHRLTFRVPGKQTEIEIEPARAHTTTTEGEETVLLAFLGPQSSVKLTWRYQPEEVEVEPPLVFSNDVIDLRVEERVLRGEARFELEVLRTPAKAFTVELPESIQVLEVSGANIKTWGFADEARRRLSVTLHKEVSGKYALSIGFEGPVEVPGPLSVPTFRVADAARERGHLRVSSAEGVGLRPVSAENTFQVDVNSLPKAIRGGHQALGYRFPALPWALSLRTERIAPLVSLTTRARLEVDRHTVKVHTDLGFEVERAGIFELTIEIPQGIVLTQIGHPKLVDSWRERTEGDRRLLTVVLRGRQIGSFLLPIRAVAPLDLETGRLAVPLLKVRNVDREEGTLGVYMHQGIKAVARTKGVVPMEPAKLRGEDPFASELPLAFAWRWRGSEADVVFDVEARKPKVTADVRYTLQAEEARVSLRADLVYTVQYNGVETFRFRVPKRMVETMKVDAANLREKSHAEDPVEEGEEPTATWTVALQGPALGEVVVTVEYDDVFPEALEVNQSRTPRIPAVVPLEVERATTHVAIRKSPVIKVTPETAQYEQVDASELPAGLQSADVFLALRRFDEPAGFLLSVIKHEYQPVADLVVRHVHLKTVVIDEQRASTTAFFEVLNNDRQFLAIRLPEDSKVQELQVAGVPEKPRLGAEGELLVRLKTGLRKDATFQVALAYTHPIETSGAIGRQTRIVGPVLPAYEENPKPFQALLTWSVHYPEAWEITSFAGNVAPAEEAARLGSWLRTAILSLGQLVRATAPPSGRPPQAPAPLGSFRDIVPVYTQRESVETVFTNGVGDGVVLIGHTTTTARVIFIVISAIVGAGAVIGLARVFKPFHAGCGVVFVALILLALAGPGWVPIWNAVFVAALATTVAMMAIELRRALA